MSDTIVIYCKDCGAMFYANSRILPEDVLEIAEYAKAGHQVAMVDSVNVRLALASCRCGATTDKDSTGND